MIYVTVDRVLKKALSSLFLAGGAALTLSGMAVPNDDDYLAGMDFTLGLEGCAPEYVFTDMAKCVKILDYVRFEEDGSGSLTRIEGGQKDLWDTVVSGDSSLSSFGDAEGYWGRCIQYYLGLGFESSEVFVDGNFAGVTSTVHFANPPELEAILAGLGLAEEGGLEWGQTTSGLSFDLNKFGMGYPDQLREFHVNMPSKITSTSGTEVNPFTVSWDLDSEFSTMFAYSDLAASTTTEPGSISDSGSSLDSGSGGSPSSGDDGWFSEGLCWWIAGGGTLGGFFLYLCDNERKVKGYERDPRKRQYWAEFRLHF